jgi:hypothetical protein
MIRLRYASALFLMAVCFLVRDARARDESKYLYRFYGGPVLAFYNNNPDYTINTRARASLTSGARIEYLFTGYSSITAAVEYMTHGLRFDSYFFEPGQQIIYDKTFPFHHKVRLHEAHLPIIAKYNFTKENDKILNGYAMVGWGYRYIFASRSTITSNVTGDKVWRGKINADEEYHLFTRKGGSMLLAGFGTERNFQPNRTSGYIELIYKFGLSRFRYQGSGTAREFFIKDSFLSVCIGYKI